MARQPDGCAAATIDRSAIERTSLERLAEVSAIAVRRRPACPIRSSPFLVDAGRRDALNRKTAAQASTVIILKGGRSAAR